MSIPSVNDGNFGDFLQPSPANGNPNSITAFLAKLWALVNDSSCDDLIAWDPSGSSFHVYDQARFAREILPRYFKHNNFASFIRQLNMYGFRKMSTIEHGSLKSERDDIEFAHPSFLRGQENLLELIKRRAPDQQQQQQQKSHVQPIKHELPPPIASNVLLSSQQAESKAPATKDFGHLLDDVRTLQNKQSSLSDKLFHLEDENQALWREIGSLRQKHNKQQQIVSKLMEFLLHILTGSNQNHRRSVEQPLSTRSEQQRTSHSTSNLEPMLSSHGLKRKPAALMLSEEPKKRPATRPEHLFNPSKTLNDGEQQSRIVINELTDNDTGGFHPTTNASPLIDLVPSLPPAVASNTPLPTLNYEWINPSSNEQTTEHFLPDFFLNADQTQLNDINTSHQSPTGKLLPQLKEEEIELVNYPSSNDGEKHLTLNSTLYPADDTSKSSNPSDGVTFSLDEFTGHVDHIQSSLNSIREFMFNKLTDGTMIDDLFSDEHVLLSPFLPPTSNLLSDEIIPSAKSYSIGDEQNDVNQRFLQEFIQSTPPLRNDPQQAIKDLDGENFHQDERRPLGAAMRK